ncbi:MAG TPA: HdeD family acid-resistance protein [Candidatus Binatia bacterium]|nr:HdeD family acid-resistance protein [Candidatus Binatia bacterium]
MVHVLARNWWMWLLRGIAAVIFGILAYLWPGATWVAIAILFGAYALVDGILAILGTIRAAEAHQTWWPFLVEGVIGILIAGITFYDVRITLMALYWTIAAWAFLTGIFEIVGAVQLRKQISNEIWLIVAGVASIAFGVLMIWFPMAGALAIIWLIAAYAIVFGIVMIAFSLRLRSHANATTPLTS